jgi:hypothetical protein
MSLRLVEKLDLPQPAVAAGEQTYHGFIEHIFSEQDDDSLIAMGVHVAHNYFINKIYVKDSKDADYILANLAPHKTVEKIEASDDEILQVAHTHLTRLNSNLIQLHHRLAERLQRMEAM